MFRREDVLRVRVTFDDGVALVFDVDEVALYFFLDADVAILAVELWANDIPLERAQDMVFRFGRAYPAWWTSTGEGGNCPRRVEWLDAGGAVLAVSDYEQKQNYLSHVARYRTPYLAAHWQFLVKPLGLEYPGQTAALRYRQLEHYRMPIMVYLALEDPHRAVARGVRADRPHDAPRARAARCRTRSGRSPTSRRNTATIVFGRAKASNSRAMRA